MTNPVTIIMVEDGDDVKKDQVIFTWDPYTNPIITDVDGLGVRLETTEGELLGVQQTHAGAFSRQGQRQVGRGGALAHPALARGHGDDVAHLRQELHPALCRMGDHAGADVD